MNDKKREIEALILPHALEIVKIIKKYEAEMEGQTVIIHYNSKFLQFRNDWAFNLLFNGEED